MLCGISRGLLRYSWCLVDSLGRDVRKEEGILLQVAVAVKMQDCAVFQTLVSVWYGGQTFIR